MSVLDTFHTHVSGWFSDHFSSPTPVQKSSWPQIQSGQHLLITAPTGSGKTLTAFLSAIDQLVKGELPRGECSVLYISPLKALNNDIHRNLEQPLSGIEAVFREAGDEWVPPRVAVRSGDTSQTERQRILRQPPEIFITTPESLALMLTTEKGRRMLATIRVVILDEIHAVIDSRRGAQLMVCLERLVDLSGEFQRIALSATVHPLQKVANFIAGVGEHESYRPVHIVDTKQAKEISFEVRLPKEVRDAFENGDSTWPALIKEFQSHIERNQSTLFFSASRRQAERIVSMLNEGQDETLVYAHHGSLSREIRTEVETRLKQGALKAIVATSSLELGIDIGSLDEVVLVQSPESIASAFQRIGRAGHQVGEQSRATLYPMFARDFVDAAVVSGCIEDRVLEPVHFVEEPLDLLAQTVVSMVATETWHADRLFEVVKRSTPYRNLSVESFELVLQMLSGKYERTRIRDLRPRIDYDPDTGLIESRKGATLALYTSGGTIPDRGYFQLRHADSKTFIGELDEEFVWETQPGKKFVFGSQQWVVDRITHNDVLVHQDHSRDSIPPFYRSEFINKSFFYATRASSFLEMANRALESGQEHLINSQLRDWGFDERSAEFLIEHLHEQRDSTGVAIPHAKHVLFELIHSGPSGYSSSAEERQLIIHTGWGGAVNRPIAMCLASEWESRWDTVPDIAADNEVIALQMKQDIQVDEIVELLSPDDLIGKLRKSLEKSSFFGARFRECAGRALLLSKKRFDRRMPLWLTRMQAKDLMDSVLKYSDFPILLETWRTCIQDEFDMDSAQQVLDDLATGEIKTSFVEMSNASPFARAITHEQMNRYVYLDDSPEARGRVSSLSDELISQAVGNAALRPDISPDVVQELERKLQRQALGYEPSSEREVMAWLKERVWISEVEWFDWIEVPETAIHVVYRGKEWYIHPKSQKLIQLDLATAIANALQFYGPRTQEQLLRLFPVEAELLQPILNDLISSGELVSDIVIAGEAERFICDRRNLDILLRFQRRKQRVAIKAQPLEELPNFLSTWHNFGEDKSDAAILASVERLQGFVAPVAVWFSAIWGSRHWRIQGETWMRICSQYGISWQGKGSKRITIGPTIAFDIGDSINETDESFLEVFKDPHGYYSYLQLQQSSQSFSSTFDERFWEIVWKGLVTSDSIEVLATAVAQGFKSVHQPRRTSNTRRWMRHLSSSSEGTQSSSGLWHRIHRQPKPDNPLDQLEETKEVARILFDRYGVVSREICKREGGQFSWSKIFVALRSMELSGEIVSGWFFEGMSGPQFATPEALRHLQEFKAQRTNYWVHSFDPVAPCGLGVDWDDLPARSENTMLAFAEGELVAISKSKGRNLRFLKPVDDPCLLDCVRSIQEVVSQNKLFTIVSINDEPALQSEYLSLIEQFHTVRRTSNQAYVEAVIN